MRYILPILIFASLCWSQPDPNIPVLRTYIGEPDVDVSFDFRVIDLDGDRVNVSVISSLVFRVPAPLVDPNGLMRSYTGRVVSASAGDFWLLVVADDRKAGDTRPFGDTGDLPRQARAYIKIEIRRRNRAPLIR